MRHTCLALMCRFLAYRFLEPRPSERDLWDAISGDYFVGAGLGNFLGEDFFSWPFFRLSMGIGDDAPSMDAARSLMSILEALDFDQPPPGLLPAMYREYRGSTGALDREAGNEAEISALGEEPQLLCLSPYCGDGTALASAVRTVITTRIASGQFPVDGLLEISAQFLGMTSDPLAANVASLSFLLALGEEVTEPHPPILVPVYLANASQVPTERIDPDGTRTYTIEAAGGPGTAGTGSHRPTVPRLAVREVPQLPARRGLAPTGAGGGRGSTGSAQRMVQLPDFTQSPHSHT